MGTKNKQRKVQHLPVILRITGFLTFVHPPEFYILENTTFRKLDQFPSSGEGKETPNIAQWLRLTLCKGLNRGRKLIQFHKRCVV
jgi:hypothetical protein